MSVELARVRAVVFDLDGTLIDSRCDIARCANLALRRAGFAELELHEIMGYVGDGARALLARAARLSRHDARLDALVEDFMGFYIADPVRATRLTAGAERALRELAGFPLALCTNKPRGPTDAVLAGLGLAENFRVVVAGGDTARNKPHPEPLLTIARAFDLPPSSLLMVGDGPQDIECGKRAGALTAGVFGIAKPALLQAAEPDLLIGDLNELVELLRQAGGVQATSV